MVAALAALALTSAAPPTDPIGAASKDIAAACGTREGWSDPAPPAHIYGNSWYVGTCGITVVLIETNAGLVLIDSGPLEAMPHVLASIRALGFDPKQVKWLLTTHEHFDHGGGIAAIQAETGARLAAGPFAAEALRSGKPYPDDPQLALLVKLLMAPARVDLVISDGDSLNFGGVRFTAHSTPVHTSGSTSWTWQACESEHCKTIALLDSSNTISAPGYRFADHPERANPAYLGLKRMLAMPCDILLTPHPGGSDLLERLSSEETEMIDPHACKRYASSGMERLAKRLIEEEPKK